MAYCPILFALHKEPFTEFQRSQLLCWFVKFASLPLGRCKQIEGLLRSIQVRLNMLHPLEKRLHQEMDVWPILLYHNG